MLQMERQPGFIQEHLHKLLVLGEVRKDALDRNVPLQTTNGGLRYAAEDLSHTASIQTVGEFIALMLHGIIAKP